MYYITITETRSVTIPCKQAKSTDEALLFVANEYRDNRHSALATDEDWDSVELSLSCKTHVLKHHTALQSAK